jgi:hypothetical protein
MLHYKQDCLISENAVTDFVGPYQPTADKGDVCVSYFVVSADLLK